MSPQTSDRRALLLDLDAVAVAYGAPARDRVALLDLPVAVELQVLRLGPRVLHQLRVQGVIRPRGLEGSRRREACCDEEGGGAVAPGGGVHRGVALLGGRGARLTGFLSFWWGQGSATVNFDNWFSVWDAGADFTLMCWGGVGSVEVSCAS